MVSIAIVGAGGVFPGAPDLDCFWEIIRSGRDVSSDVPEGRWRSPAETVYRSGEPAPDRVYSIRGYFVEETDFQAETYNLDPGLASRLDPSCRLLLRAGKQAVESSVWTGVDRSRVGIILGNIALPTEAASSMSLQIIGQTLREQRPDIDLTTGLYRYDPINRFGPSLPSDLLALAFGFSGGTYTLDAACSSSLFALKLACEELERGRADVMLAGGMSRPDSLYTQMGFSQLRAMSPTGRCRPFDAAADGLVVGEGAGILILKRLDDALTAGDRIWGLIRGYGISNDIRGNLLAPDSNGQLKALRSAYKMADWAPWDVDLIECHATGTPLGDRVEFESLQRLWDGAEPRAQSVLGTVKANIGHLLTGAGASSVIKVLLALRNRYLPPAVNFETPPSYMNERNSPFLLLKEGRDWDPQPGGRPKKAAVNGFGFGGTNAHVLLEEWIGQDDAPPRTRPRSSLAKGRAVLEPVAVVAVDAVVGPWSGEDQIWEKLMGRAPGKDSKADRGWWGVEHSEWFRRICPSPETLEGNFIEALEIPIGRFRIPPAEIREMLPQQALMLSVAAGAWEQTGSIPESGERLGAVVGLGLDPNTTNYHLRWSMREWVRQRLVERGQDPSSVDFSKTLDQYGQSICPSLTAGRVVGALGSIVASRIAKAFHIGGPCFTVSGLELSGLRALDIGLQSLRSGETDLFLTGAVDFGGDIRTIAFSLSGGHSNTDPAWSEGAVALVLKRLDDAVRDKDRIRVVIDGVEFKGGQRPAADGKVWRGYTPTPPGHRIDLLERPEESEAVSLEEAARFSREDAAIQIGWPAASISKTFGASGAISASLSVLRAVMCLDKAWLPPVDSKELSPAGRSSSRGAYWIHNQAEGPRHADIICQSATGQSGRIVLSSHPHSGPAWNSEQYAGGNGRSCGLFLIHGRDRDEIKSGLGRLIRLASKNSGSNPDRLARLWSQSHGGESGSSRCLALVAGHGAGVADCAQKALSKLDVDRTASIADGTVFYFETPLGGPGRVALVFPGSGNHFQGMGLDLAASWPEVFARLNTEYRQLLDHFMPDTFWGSDPRPGEQVDARAAIIGQVAVSATMADVLSLVGIPWQAVIGHSLGESAALIATRVWSDRDELFRRVSGSTLFSRELAGDFNAARKSWGLPPGDRIAWASGVVNVSPERVRSVLDRYPKVYLQIINTPGECLIGGEKNAVAAVVADLKCVFAPVESLSSVHCPVVRVVSDEYRRVHLFDTDPRGDIDYYSAAWGGTYQPTGPAAADSITAQALATMDFPGLIEQAYEDGIRIFVETGPGASCTRLIDRILEGRPHAATAAYVSGRDSVLTALRAAALCAAHGISLNTDRLYPAPEQNRETRTATDKTAGTIRIPTGRPAIMLPDREDSVSTVEEQAGGSEQRIIGEETAESDSKIEMKTRATISESRTATPRGLAVEAALEAQQAAAEAHAMYLKLAQRSEQTMVDLIRFQQALLGGGSIKLVSKANSETKVQQPAAASQTRPALTREQCLEYARGGIGPVLGDAFAEIDRFPTRVRLPDEPLMLVDRIMAIEAEPFSMSHGRVVTEHDVLTEGWYLDNGRIPACIAIEAGQADLFLSGYLGVDLETRGEAVYRLLDAEVTFHAELPVPGQVIRYDIRIDHFFRHGETILFRFNFDATVDGRSLMTMRNGCAGFFTPEELSSGKGLVPADLKGRREERSLPEGWAWLVPQARESFDDQKMRALYRGDLAGCFGGDFKFLSLKDPNTLPGGRMELIDRVLELDPRGGRYGLGLIKTEMDIHPDDWFLTCHFVDDMVMPGTLMYECCLHSLRIFMMRLGWVGEKEGLTYEPLPGTAGRLKCRGQVVATTRKAAYEIHVKELRYDPEPVAIADGIMYADDRPIVHVEDMSVCLRGATREKLTALWSQKKRPAAVEKKFIFSREQVLAIAEGKPSEAFGEPYRVFDRGRFVARLPRPPYSFIDRVGEPENLEPFVMKAGGRAAAEYDVPADAWYFKDNDGLMPYAVLNEVALQPCGWMSAYVGSSLSLDTDLYFRNLGGEATQRKRVTPDSGCLTTRVHLTKVSSSGEMIIQHYDFAVYDDRDVVYDGQTYFGFFSKSSLARQAGIQEDETTRLESVTAGAPSGFDIERTGLLPGKQLRMIDSVETISMKGGPHDLGFARAVKIVNPDDWYFNAHFYQDPVWPGSLGLEALCQLLKVFAAHSWGDGQDPVLEIPTLGQTHGWVYRGQVIPDNRKVIVEAVVVDKDDANRTLTADGFLRVDGLLIYRMSGFTVRQTG